MSLTSFFQGHTGEITCLAFATDAYIASGSRTGHILVHGLQQGTLVGKIALTGDASTAASARCLSVFGTTNTKPMLAVGSDSGALHVLDVNSRSEARRVAAAHRSPIAGAAAVIPFVYVLCTYAPSLRW